MPADAVFTVRLVDWTEAAEGLRYVRRAVFINEQAIPEDMEWDEFDAVCRHALAEDAAGAAIGCGRLLPDGHIGRLAVLAAWRGRGVGAALLRQLVELARVRGSFARNPQFADARDAILCAAWIRRRRR